MKELHGSASAEVGAPRERCLQLLADVERYRDWYPDVIRRVEALERNPNGTPTAAEADLHAPNVPLLGDFTLHLRIDVSPPDAVTLTRVPHGPDDPERFTVSWRLRETGTGTLVELALDARLSVPRLVPIGGLGDTLASGFVTAAERVLSQSPEAGGAVPGSAS